MTDLLADLNDAQAEAVTTTEGFVRVIAGAGSGKTRALTRRFAYLVRTLGILPSQILCVTFTNKAASEMRARIHNLTGDRDTGLICTFHSFCVTVLQEDANAIGYPKSFMVVDNSDIDEMLKIIYEERGLSLRDLTFARAREEIEIQKLFKRPEYYRELIEMSVAALEQKYRRAEGVIDIIFYGYLYQQKKCFALDYNDLLKLTLYIFATREPIKLKWQQRLEYIMIDEFQDIDGLQYELMSVLAAYHRNLFVVGDPDQTIYTWRGADVKYLLDFPQHFPPTHTIVMTQNYRSTPQILAVANALIRHNRDRVAKDLQATRPDGVSVKYNHALTPIQEAAFIVAQITALAARGVAYRDITILYRAHYLTRPLETELLKHDLPYMIYSGVPFYARAEIKDALAYLRLIAYQDDLSLTRVLNVPKRNLGQRRLAALKQTAAREKISLYQTLQRSLDEPLFQNTGAGELVALIESLRADYSGRAVSQVLAEVLDRSGYEKMRRTEGSQERLDNLAELKQAIFEYETTCGEEATLEHYLAHVALFTTGDIDERGDRVKLMTVHAAKGLEFPHVLVCGLEENVFPSKRTDSRERMEEERRLAFVALTRAQQSLTLSSAGGYGVGGAPRYPSRFILDIGAPPLECVTPLPETLIAATREYIAARDDRASAQRAPALFGVGQRVRHPVFGAGVIGELDTDKRAYLIQFDTKLTPRLISFAAALTAE